MKSIVQGRPEVCPYCYANIPEGTGDWHHIYNGANRKKSTEDGMVVHLHHECHMHIHSSELADLFMKARYQKVWCEYYGKSTDDFIKRYGKNYQVRLEEFQKSRK